MRKIHQRLLNIQIKWTIMDGLDAFQRQIPKMSDSRVSYLWLLKYERQD